jgi:SAM-dependent methyltransferase
MKCFRRQSDLARISETWNTLASQKPLEAILAPAAGSPNQKPEAFFRSGEEEIEGVMRYLPSTHRSIPRRRALDFGCGIGRLTQPLCGYFDEVHGVDIAPRMIEQAQARNKHPGRCHYHHNPGARLAPFPDRSFDLIYSNITLQHLKPHLIKGYLIEFLRSLSLDGLLIFQLPAAPRSNLMRHRIRTMTPQAILDRYRRIRHGDVPLADTYYLGKDEVCGFITKHGGQIVDIQPDQAAGPQWIGFRYCVAKS